MLAITRFNGQRIVFKSAKTGEPLFAVEVTTPYAAERNKFTRERACWLYEPGKNAKFMQVEDLLTPFDLPHGTKLFISPRNKARTAWGVQGAAIDAPREVTILRAELASRSDLQALGLFREAAHKPGRDAIQC